MWGRPAAARLRQCPTAPGSSAPAEPIDPTTDAIHGGENTGALLGGEITPRHGDAQPGVRLVQRAASAFKAQPRITAGRTETFGDVERHAAQRAPNLRSQVAVAPRDR